MTNYENPNTNHRNIEMLNNDIENIISVIEQKSADIKKFFSIIDTLEIYGIIQGFWIFSPFEVCRIMKIIVYCLSDHLKDEAYFYKDVSYEQPILK